MDLSTQRLMMGAAGSAAPAYVEDVFSTWLYTGNGSTQTITNGIDLSGKGGLIWCKRRDSLAYNHLLYDTARGVRNYISSDTTTQAQTQPSGYGLTSFNSSGFTVGDYSSTGYGINESGALQASWTFRKAAKFFDVVTYTGTGSARTIAHNLGSVPGCIIIKRTDANGDWPVYHVSLGNTDFLELNQTQAKLTNSAYWNNTTPTSTVFSLGDHPDLNSNGGTYVAYLFAHDAGGFGDSGNDSVVKCGSYTGTSFAGNFVNLGWEPQWVLIKNSTSSANWIVLDNMRGIVTGSDDAYLVPNASNAESTFGIMSVEATGFTLTQGSTLFNATGNTYIYIAIRRGPMKTPTDATKVFSAKATSGTNTTNFPVDMFLYAIRAGDAQNSFVASRLTGSNGMSTALTDAERADGWTGWDSNTTRGSVGTGQVEWDFRRAPGFFDVVAYTGTGVARTINHNLGVVPELGIFKIRSTTGFWLVYNQALGNNDSLVLQLDSPASGPTSRWDNTSPTNQVFTLGAGGPNASGQTYIGYLFASCPGVSKVGSYTGTGTTLQVNCGFTSGARFVLIKRTDSTGDWYVWDSARGIVAGNDPYLLLNSTAAEVTGTDYVDTYSAGFEISSTAPAAINANGGNFIFLAIA